MKKLICALATLLPLSGCWWNDAPETYKGVATVTFDNGESFSQDFTCDFRAQQATRHCDIKFHFDMKNWISAERIDFPQAEKEKLGFYYASMENQFGSAKAGENLRKSASKGSIEISIDAHARKDDRYLLNMMMGSWWSPDQYPTAPREGTNYKFYVLEDDALGEGFEMGFSSNFEDLVEFRKFVTPPLQRAVWKFFRLQYHGPARANVEIRWEPVPANSLTS
ncbi:hypothetical protein [Thalassospira lucentensis]|uniref:hypothetical protein n=1 Tax=Thalassospira lucentensis TaxID=168935 RepID=UPI002943974A|nr:hypothetical protein [Thalassospira lucentensis]WOI08937.1 hypothetical protein R1T41_00480 [Thalassospira lucentensis]